MQPPGVIQTAFLYRPLHAELIALLGGLDSSAWSRPTACSQWSVKDIALHLLDVDIRRLSFVRDNLDLPQPETPIDSYDALVMFLNGLNASWISAARRISPRLLVELLAVTGPLVADHVDALDMQVPARFPVSWAGDEVSPNWFDVGRDYTERWHHQQQIRDAVGAPGLTSRYWMSPVLEIFMLALPRTYRAKQASSGTAIVVEVAGDAGGVWTLVHAESGWKLFTGAAPDPDCKVTLHQDTAWRLFTKGIARAEAIRQVAFEGSTELGSPLLDCLAVMA